MRFPVSHKREASCLQYGIDFQSNSCESLCSKLQLSRPPDILERIQAEAPNDVFESVLNKFLHFRGKGSLNLLMLVSKWLMQMLESTLAKRLTNDLKRVLSSSPRSMIDLPPTITNLILQLHLL